MLTFIHLNNILKYYRQENDKVWTTKDSSYHNTIRAIGAMEGIMLSFGYMFPDTPLDYKEIEVEGRTWWGKRTKLSRKQTYNEFIVERFETFVTRYSVIRNDFLKQNNEVK